MGIVKQISGDVSEPAALAMGDSGADNLIAEWVLRQLRQESADGRVMRFTVHRCDAGRRLGVQLEDLGVLTPDRLNHMDGAAKDRYLADLIRDICLGAAVDAHGPCAASEYAVVCFRENDPTRRRSTCFFAPNEAPLAVRDAGNVGEVAAALLRQSHQHIEVSQQSIVLLAGAMAQNAEAMGKFWMGAAAAKEAENQRLRQELEEKRREIESAATLNHEREMEGMQIAQNLRIEDAKQKRWDDLFGWVLKTGGPMIMDWIGEAKKDPKAKPDDRLVKLGRIISDLPNDAKAEFTGLFMALPAEQGLAWQKVVGDINAAKVAADKAQNKAGADKIAAFKGLIEDLSPEQKKQFDAVIGKLTDEQRAAWETIIEAKE